MAKRKAAPVRAASASARDMREILAVTGDAPGTLLMLIAMCDQIIARRSTAKISSSPPTDQTENRQRVT